MCQHLQLIEPQLIQSAYWSKAGRERGGYLCSYLSRLSRQNTTTDNRETTRILITKHSLALSLRFVYIEAPVQAAQSKTTDDTSKGRGNVNVKTECVTKD